MKKEINEIISRSDINVDSIEKILKNAGISVAKKNENSIYIESLDLGAVVKVSEYFILILIPFSVREGVDMDRLQSEIHKMNSKMAIGDITINASNDIVFSLSYLTISGFYIPHFISTVDAFFSISRESLNQNDLSEFLE
ncbi:hypothetical protein GKR56_17195 [Providencia alcalifaciens]|uniref:Uncharacterized protein n=1 Tax=Providencia rettgeri TaxID=587 RepID=A0AAE2ZFP0_PRORE|nr:MULTISPECIES: hypothetical protein [Providencia]MBW3118882.1 hypothetical protein [Providencia rettgeri]MTC54959.1 hypothetical protein [Providencia alcalifaciens]NHN54118.1 hypothetical protein [Providencia rettgeri]